MVWAVALLRRMGVAGIVAGALLPVSSAATADPVAPMSVTVEGTQFKVTLTDGRVLRSPELVGAVLSLTLDGQAARIRIDAVEPDPRSPGVLLHTLSTPDGKGGWTNICEAGPDGRRQGFPLAGRAEPDGTIAPAEAGALVLTCTGGAEGKCVRFGYHPWENLPDGVPMLPVYNACVHLVRADYAGDGHGTTRNGQRIDIYDSLGIQKPDNDPIDAFEAGWTAAGAVCVRHVRVKENTDLARVEASSPRLRGRVGDICTETFARAQGAVLFVRSPR